MLIEVCLFRVDEFVKFGEFDEKLLVHTKSLDWGGDEISLIPIYDYTAKFIFHLSSLMT